MVTSPFPPLLPEQQAACDALTRLLADEIAAEGGAIPFSRFMERALYAPQYGYYTGGAHKIGRDGDFVTAPLLSPLFAQTLARQLAQILPQTDGNVYEFGAGTGVLAAQLLNALSGSLKHYYIVELSPELAERQRRYLQQHAPEHAHKAVHLTALPEYFDGVIIGNEVLDAMPVERITRAADGSWQQAFVAWENDGFVPQLRPLASPALLQAAAQYFPPQPDYTSELHPAQYAFVHTLAQKLRRGGMIWLDYGFDAAQYYHPQRQDGTLIGHHRHHTVHDPFFRVGLTDLTAHVNFTDIAQAATDAGLDLIGYTTQGRFLLNAGITECLAQSCPDPQSPAYFQAAAAVNVLTAQHEMGELFKVIAFGKDTDPDWLGFTAGDLCHKL